MEKILKEYGQGNEEIIALYLFVSYAEDKQRPESDVDIAVLTEPYKNKQESFMSRLKFKNDIAKLLNKEIDLVIFQETGEILSYQIIKNGRVVFERDRDKLSLFKSKTIVQYLDYQFLLKKMQKGMIVAIRKEALNGR
ncbi:MAG: nucleotidyltransferase domain-containing protein [bacterium]